MFDRLHILDKKLSFTRKRKDLTEITLLQLYRQRYGIGNRIAKRIIAATATHPSLRVKDYRYNSLNGEIRRIFEKRINVLDTDLKKKMTLPLQRHVEVRNYRGDRYSIRLPINGQRRRTNANTCKRVRPYQPQELVDEKISANIL